MRLLHRLGGKAQVVKVPAAAVITRGRVSPQFPHYPDAFVGQGCPFRHRDTQGGEFLGHSSDAQAERNPAVGHTIQGSGVFSQFHRVVVGQHQHRSSQAHPPGSGSQVGKGSQGMVIGLVVQPFPDVAVVKEMIHHPDRVIAQFLGQRPESQDLLHILQAPVIGDGNAELHKLTSGLAGFRGRIARILTPGAISTPSVSLATGGPFLRRRRRRCCRYCPICRRPG